MNVEAISCPSLEQPRCIRRRFKRKLIAGGVLTALILGIPSLVAHSPTAARLFSPILRLNRIEVTGTRYLPSAEVLQFAGLESSPWVWTISSSTIRKKLKTHPWINQAKVFWKLFPLSLVLQVEEPHPVLISEIEGESWLVSRQGTFLVGVSELTFGWSKDTELLQQELAELPKLVLDPALSNAGSVPGNRIFQFAFNLVRVLEEAGGFPFPVEGFYLRADHSLVVQSKAITPVSKIVISASDVSDAREQFRKLAAVLADIRSRREEVSSIDLRFDDQAVVVPIARN